MSIIEFVSNAEAEKQKKTDKPKKKAQAPKA
jgi:hypothetical protein